MVFFLLRARQADWLEKACPAIQQRIERYAASEIRFNLMAMVQDRRVRLGKQLEQLTAERAQLAAQMNDSGGGGGGSSMEVGCSMVVMVGGWVGG